MRGGWPKQGVPDVPERVLVCAAPRAGSGAASCYVRKARWDPAGLQAGGATEGLQTCCWERHSVLVLLLPGNGNWVSRAPPGCVGFASSIPSVAVVPGRWQDAHSCRVVILSSGSWLPSCQHGAVAAGGQP